MGKNFPVSGCYVCGNRILNKDGSVIAFNYVRNLEELKEDYVNGKLDEKNERFVDSLIFQCYSQFPEFSFNRNLRTGDEIGLEILDNILEYDFGKSRNLEKLENILKNPVKEKFLFLLSHKVCVPEGFGLYWIDLKRIDSAERALEWTFHLSEKNWFNYKGWIKILESLFGRKGVS